MIESHSKQLNFSLCGPLIRFVYILISLFACFGSSYHLKEASADVGPATLSDSGNLTEDCARIHNVLRRVFLSLNKTKGDISYRVRLKLFTVHQDTLNILKMPAFANVEPMAIFNKDKHRGFTAALTMEQVCELYHLPIVSNIAVCQSATPLNPRCVPTQSAFFWPFLGAFPETELINVTVDTESLISDCAKIIRQIATNIDKDLYQAGRFYAGLKPFVTRNKAEDLIYSKEMIGTSFMKREDEMWSSGFLVSYEGRWNYTQLCDLEHRPEVSYVGMKRMWEPLFYSDYLTEH